ncbi:MAG TPA: hypothetical protein PK874_01445 [Desulfobacteraceae bacterium]|nr:hypothetical protein [Desulfobacteraceae bacterium]HPJ66590.1 hypothetical protein [Desulfobacteraceae bacterium]
MAQNRVSKIWIFVFVVIFSIISNNRLMAALPSIITSLPTGVDGYSATLNGSVNPGNESTDVTFEYSTDANFPEEETPDPIVVTADQSPISGSSYNAVSVSITGLTPGTVYYYRIVAVNGSGTAEGGIQQFSTSPPATVTTGIASPVTTTTATLNGTVNANGNDTVVTFEYGLTTGYGTTVTADQSPVTGASDTPVSTVITGLTPDTTYHFRVLADNTLGTSSGEDMTFFTSAQTAPSVTTDDATFSYVPNTATLNGLVNANNADATVTFEYGTTTAYGNTVTAAQSPVLGSSETSVSSYITGLVPDTTYHYRAVAVNSVGTTNGADMTFYNTVAPYAKTEGADSITQTSANLIGTVNPKVIEDGPDTTVTFEYGLTSSYGNTVTAIESPLDGGGYNKSVSYILTGLSPNTTYHYRVIASNINGTGTGDDETFITSSLPIVSTETAAPVGTDSATLNGMVNANDDITTVTFEYGQTASYGNIVTADQSPVSGTADTAVSKAITGLANGTTYHFRVVGSNSSGTVYGEDRTFMTGISPPAVTTDAASGIGVNTATMNGTVNANGLSTAVSFEWGFTTAYDRTNTATPGTVTGDSNTPVSFTPTTLLPNTTYHYRVAAQNEGGTVYGADMFFTTVAAPTVATNAATSVTTSGATLHGTVNANDQSSIVTFEYGTTTSYGTSVTADQSPVTGSTDTAVSKAITGLTSGITYHYRVVGTNASGTSYGEDVTFIASLGPPIVTTGLASPLVTGAIIHGTVNALNSSTAVTVEYGTTIAYGFSVTADQSPVTGSNDTAITATITGLSFNVTYHYRVVGTNSYGTTNGADMTFKTTLNPSAITGEATDVQATFAVVNGIANGNGGSWSVRFDYGTTIAYGSSQTANPAQASGNTDTPVTAELSGLTPGTTYHYRTTVYSGGINYYGSDMTLTTISGPSVTTNAASAVGGNTATLNGTVNANNNSTTVTFEYGETISYDRTITADQSPVTGSTDTAVSIVLNSLLPGTTYHYRAVGSNTTGTVYGADMTFTALSIPPSATTESATGIGAGDATLNGSVNPNNDSTTVTFEYGLTTAYGTTVTADQSPVTGNNETDVSKGITGLANNTTYHYRVVAQNSSGTTYGADMTFTTGVTPPTAVTNPASGVGISAATLHGTINPNNSSTTVTFEFGETTGYGRTATADQSPVTGSGDTPVSTNIDLLTANTLYHYRVCAQNAAGSTCGADMTFTTNAAGTPAVTTAGISNITATTATCGGNVSDEGGAPVTARGVCWSTSANPTTSDSITSDGSGAGVFTSSLTGLSPLTTYYVRAYATNFYGTVYGDERIFITLPFAPAVTTDAATAVGPTYATLNGTVNANGDSTTVTFEYGADTSYGKTVTADQSPFTGSVNTAVSSSIAGLVNDTIYHYRVVAENTGGRTYGEDMKFKTAAESPIPTISETGVIILGIMLMFIGLASLRKRERA